MNLAKRFNCYDGWVRQNPMLLCKDKQWALHFPFEKHIKLPDKDFVRPVLAVDLGLRRTAVACVVHSDGTVTHREFLTYGGEKDRMDDTLGRIAGKSARTYLIAEGERFCAEDCRIVRNLTDEIAHRCSVELVKLALRYDCQAIVFEHLGKLSVPRC
jgi:hypothetical protein